MRVCISLGVRLSARWHFSGQITRLRSTTKSGMSMACGSSFGAVAAHAGTG